MNYMLTLMILVVNITIETALCYPVVLSHAAARNNGGESSKSVNSKGIVLPRLGLGPRTSK